MGIIYNQTLNKQSLLQGHVNKITCTTVAGEFVCTGDEGPGSMVCVWSNETVGDEDVNKEREWIPIKTMFDPHKDGVKCVRFSADRRFLITLGNGTLNWNISWYLF